MLINYTKGILNVKNGTLIKVFPMVLSFISIILICKKTYLPLMYVILFFVYMMGLKKIFEESLGVIYVIIITQIFFLIIFRDITLCIFSFFSGKSMYETIQCFKIYVLSFAIVRLIMILIIVIFKKVCNKEMIKKILINEKKIRVSDLIIFGMIIVLLNSNRGYYYLGNERAILIIIIINRICILLCYACIFNIKDKIINWIEEEVLYKTTLISVEENEKVNKKIEKYSEMLRIYNHDFRKTLLSVNDLIDTGDIEQAKNIINQYYERVEEVTTNNKLFSNNLIVNSLLNRLKSKCDEYNINFNSDCYIPNNSKLTELDLISIFNNLASNAFEACIKQENNEKKYITFKSYIKDNVLIIYQSNSFDGNIKFKNSKLVTTKNNKKLHGIGVDSIKFIVDKFNGMTLIKVEKKEFKFLIKIPIV